MQSLKDFNETVFEKKPTLTKFERINIYTILSWINLKLWLLRLSDGVKVTESGRKKAKQYHHAKFDVHCIYYVPEKNKNIKVYSMPD